MLGRLEWVQWLVPGARQRTFYLLDLLNVSLSVNSAWVDVNAEALSELEWWKLESTISPGRSFADTNKTILVEPSAQGASDATPGRFGCRLYSTLFPSYMKSRGGLVVPLPDLLTNLGKRIPETLNLPSSNTTIAYGELFAIYKAVEMAPTGSRLLLRVDNTGAMRGVQKGRFKEESLNILLGLIVEEMDKGNKLLSLRWVSTLTMERLGADGISRNRFPEEGYTISEQSTRKLRAAALEYFGETQGNFMHSLTILSPLKTKYNDENF